jgi:hypothetical protein
MTRSMFALSKPILCTVFTRGGFDDECIRRAPKV